MPADACYTRKEGYATGKSKKVKSFTETKYPAGAAGLFNLGQELFANTLLPLEMQEANRLLSFGSPLASVRQAAAAPQLGAAQQAQTALAQAMGGAIPGQVQGMLDIGQRGILPGLAAGAPLQLAEYGRELTSPLLRHLLESLTVREQQTKGGGPSALETGLGIGSTAASLATLGMAL